MRRLILASCVLPACAALMGAGDLRDLCGDVPRTHTEQAGAGRHAYSVPMRGRIDGEATRDPVGYWAFDQYWEPNLYVRLENTGDVPVVDPWLRRQDRPDTRTVRGIVDFLITPSMSDAEKARRVWEYEIRNRFHATTSDEEVDDPIKRFNCYGYTLCGNESKVMSDLWRAAGLRVRRGFPNGHSTAEVFYDGAWHLLDSDESIVCLMRDNRTIASEAQIVADHDLMKRTHTYGPLHDDDPLRDETSVALHYWEGERKGEQPSVSGHTMSFALRPGEAITWAWNPGGRFHSSAYEGGSAWVKRWRLPAHAMNGELRYAPDLTKAATLQYLETHGVEQRGAGPFGPGLYGSGAGPSTVVVPVDSAYPVVGGRLDVDFARLGGGQIKVAVSFDRGKTWREAAASFASDHSRLYVSLDDLFPATDPARYRYLLRVELPGGTAACLKGLRLVSTLQMARLALPGLSLGDNAFVYTDRSGPGARVRITHAWRECGGVEVPAAPAAAVYPAEGGRASGTRIRFQWQPVEGAADYEFQLSEHRDMRWVLSPNFHKLISRTANRGTASYELPYRGLLNPDTTYYWRVRARGAEGVWGPWSRVFAFMAEAPPVPVNVRASFDAATRTATLGWEPGAGGTKAVRYRVYGSAERGFTTNDKPYRYHAGLDGVRDAPPNLLVETETANVRLPRELWRPWYRVAAVDAAGRDSGPSEMAELPHPLIVAATLPVARAGSYYEARPAISASIGHLVSLDENGKAYQMRFRNGDDLSFELEGAPVGLAIHPKTGMIAGYLPAEAAGKSELRLTVRDARTGARDSVTLPLAVVRGAAR